VPRRALAAPHDPPTDRRVSRRSASRPSAPAAALPLPRRALHWLVPLLVIHSGVFFGLASPMRPNLLGWPIAFVPMFLALDLVLRTYEGGWRGWLLRVFACTYPVGVVFALVTGDWIVNTAYVFGDMRLPLAYATSWFGYGTLFGLETFAFLGLPFALSWRRPALAVLLVPLWATVAQVYVPRFLDFTYGQMMVTALPLVQFADTLGSGGLNLLYLPLQLVLYGWLRHWLAPAELPGRRLVLASAVLALGFAAAWAYGALAMPAWAQREAAGAPLELVGVQPNFSLGRLASNPALSHSDREESLRGLLDDSAAALARAQREPGVPTMLVWPESVYPRPYFLARGMREVVELWVQSQGVHLILTSTDHRFDRSPEGRITRADFGAAIHIGPDGTARGVYHKIALIPFGEMLPFSDVFPGVARQLREWVSNMSAFTPGSEPTVFDVDGVRVAPMICFDAANPAVALGMAANGARLGLVMANLAWFGPTTVSEQFGWFARFRAIENRMPVLFLSQNGKSWLMDSRGQDASPHLPQFQPAAFVQRVHAPRETSFYTLHATAVQRGYVLALLVLLALAWKWEWRPRLHAGAGRRGARGR
jgi:apolipoprotein N-acyltransferase